MSNYYCNWAALSVRFRTMTALATTIARIAEASARCASLTTGFRDVVTVTIPSITCAMSATRLVVERRTMLVVFLYPVQATTAVPNTKTPTTKLNSLCESSITSSDLFSEGKTAPSHNGQDHLRPSPEFLVLTYRPMT